MDLKYLVFWMKFKVLYQNTRVFVWINRFFICNNTSVLPKHEKPECKCVHTYVMWLSTSLSIAVLILNDPHGPYLHVYCLNTPYLWEITRKTNAKYVFCQDRSRNFRERQRLTSFLHAYISSMLHGTNFIYVKSAHGEMRNFLFCRSF